MHVKDAELYDPRNSTTFDERDMFIVEAALRHYQLARGPQAPREIDEGIERIRAKLYCGMSGVSLPAPDAESQTSALPRFTFTTEFFLIESIILHDALTEYEAHCRKGLAQNTDTKDTDTKDTDTKDTDTKGTDAIFSAQDECIESARRKIPRFVSCKLPSDGGMERKRIWRVDV